MMELKNTTFVVSDSQHIPLLASVLGYDNGADYVCCGKSALVSGNPMLEVVAEHDADGTLEDYVNTWMPESANLIFRLKPLMLYGYAVPEHAVYYEEFKGNHEFSKEKGRDFVLVAIRKSDLFAYAKFIEQNGIVPKMCYVCFIDTFSTNGIDGADSLMLFPEVMREYVDTLNDKGWKDEVLNVHFKNIVWLQEHLNMTNTQMSMYFGIKLRTIENWRAKPGSMPDYAWQYFVQSCFIGKQYLEHRYGSDVDSILAGCQ